MRIRKAELSDIKAIAVLFDQYRQFYKQSSDTKSAESFIGARIEKRESFIFVAENESSSELIGFVQLYPSFSSISMKPLLILNDLFVSAEYRRQGVAQHLLKASVEFARGLHAKGLTLQTARDNQTAQNLYESNGWRQESQFFTYTFKF